MTYLLRRVKLRKLIRYYINKVYVKYKYIILKEEKFMKGLIIEEP